jgi:hypothetical protein
VTDLSELNPYPVYVIWEEEAIELKPFDLRAITWAERFFYYEGENGFDRMNRLLTDQDNERELLNTVIDVVYYLGIEDFQAIGVSCPVGLKKLFNKKDDYRERLGEFGRALQQVFKNSFSQKKQEPETTGGDLYKKLTQNKNHGSGNKTDWEQIYVSFYMAGGMSINEFYKLTMKQIDCLYPEINYKISEEFSLKARMHGVKLKSQPRRRQQEEKGFTEKDIAAFEKMHNDLMKENKVN